MHPSLTTNYLLPAILLNPVLFLHSLNTILSRILPPVIAATPVQPAPYSALGPSANHPHLDIHASENLCWSYTAVMVCAQLFAFGRVSQRREEGRERRERKREERRLALLKQENEELDVMKSNGYREVGNGSLNGSTKHAKQHKRISSLKKHSSEEETEDEIIM